MAKGNVKGVYFVENPSYETMHARLKYAFGPAKNHKCIQCGKQADDWAYDHQDIEEKLDDLGRPFSENLDHYDPMCRACHRDRDKTDYCKNGHEYTIENTYVNNRTGWRYCRECRKLYMRKYIPRKGTKKI